MWEAASGLAGIQKLNSNVEVMLQLAMYAERWNDVNGRVLSEIMRRDAARVRACVQQIELAMLTRHGLVYLGMDCRKPLRPTALCVHNCLACMASVTLASYRGFPQPFRPWVGSLPYSLQTMHGIVG